MFQPDLSTLYLLTGKTPGSAGLKFTFFTAVIQLRGINPQQSHFLSAVQKHGIPIVNEFDLVVWFRGNLEFAGRVMKWTLENLYSGRGYFFYQKTTWMTKRFCLMRWCNAWMCRAIAYCLASPAALDTTRREG